MAARVLLLTAFTGLFATAWSSDRPEAPKSLLARESEQLPDRPPLDQSPERPIAVTEVRHALTVSSELDLSLVVVPEAIAPGTYRVVDAQGRVGWTTIAVEDRPEADEPARPEPVYSSQSENGRWHFIRVEAAPVIASPLAETAVLR